MKIVVTDLTRFSNPDLVCLAGIDIETGRCIRPRPRRSYWRRPQAWPPRRNLCPP